METVFGSLIFLIIMTAAWIGLRDDSPLDEIDHRKAMRERRRKLLDK